MSTPQPAQNVPDQKTPRWQFRKKKKLEKRRKKRQEYAEKNIPTDIPLAKEAEESSSLNSRNTSMINAIGKKEKVDSS